MTTTPERKIHGCILAHPRWFGQVADVFQAKDFAEPSDQKLWETFKALHDEGHEIAPLDALAALEDIEGGKAAVKELAALMRLCAHETPESFRRRVDEFVVHVQKTKTKRGLKRIITAIDEEIEFSCVETLEAMTAKVRRLDRRKTHFTPLTAARFIETASNKRRKVVIPTGFRDIDMRIGGFVQGWMTLLCARTNVGKSSFLAALAKNQFYAGAAQNLERAREQDPSSDPYTRRLEPAHARHPKTERVGERAPYVLILSVEDDVDDYVGRFICDLCDVHGKDFLLDPEHYVYAQGKGERLKSVAQTFTEDGRLTIADYENEDGDDEKTIEQLEKTIIGWKQLVAERFRERGEVCPPLLVLLDYFQKIEIDDDDGKVPEVRLLKKASSRLKKLAKKEDFALAVAVMLLRGPDGLEPDHNDARGGSDVVQDAEVVMTLWPFGPGERAAFGVAASEPDIMDADSFENAVAQEEDDELAGMLGLEEEFDDIGGFGLDELRRAEQELLITGNKGRQVEAGWQVPLAFDRPYKRITNAYDPKKIYRRDASIQTLLKEHRKAQGQGSGKHR